MHGMFSWSKDKSSWGGIIPYLLGGILLLMTACSSEKDPEVGFYHWRAEAEWTEPIAEAMDRNDVEELYMHYFDVDVPKRQEKGEGVYPEFVIREVDEQYLDQEVVPVVFITERAIEKSDDIGRLKERIQDLVEQIHRHHFDTVPERIQVDCDWSNSTRSRYFDLLEELGKSFELEVTLRLHQIKYKERTGVPPVERATLMLYNVGELEDLEKNSILAPSIVDPYLSSETDYPLQLDLALPLFEQTVIKDPEGQVRLINEDLREALSDDPSHFQALDHGIYKVVKDTFFEGSYLYEGYRLKPETVSKEAIIGSYRMLEESKLEFDKLLFYHLKDTLLQKKEVRSIVEAL